MEDFGNKDSRFSSDSDNAAAQDDMHIQVNTPEVVENTEPKPVVDDIIIAPIQDIIPVEPTVETEPSKDQLLAEDEQVEPKLEPKPELEPESEPIEPQPTVSESIASTVPSAPTYSPVQPIENPNPVNSEVTVETVKKPKKLGRKLLALIIVGILIVIIGGSVSAYTFWYSNPKKVVYDSISGLLTSDAMQLYSTTTVAMSSSTSASSFSINKVTVDTTVTNSPSQSVDLSVETTLGGKSYTVGAKGMYLSSGDIYFRLENILDTVKSAFGTQTISPAIQDEINNLQEKWVKFSVSDMTNMSADYAKTFQCALDTYKSANKDKALQKEFATLYEKSPFLTVDENNIQNKDGNYGYDVSVNAKELVAYARSIGDTNYAKDLGKCSSSFSNSTSSASDANIEESINSSMSKVKTTLWVNQWTHAMSKISVEYKDTQSTYYSTVTTNADVKVDNNLKVTAPDQSVTFSQWQSDLNKLIQSFYGN
jgi:hypothetical protein